MSVLRLIFLGGLLRLSYSFQSPYPPRDDANDTRISLNVALIMSFGGAFNSSGSVPGIQVALDLINNRSDILPGYKLHYQLMDSQCNHSVALSSFFSQVLSNPPKLGVLGSGCSLATEPTADISHFYNLTQVSCASSSSELANRVRFKAYFQMLPTEIDLADGFVAVCKQYGWRHLSIISQDENLFINTINHLKQLLLQNNITWTVNTFKTEAGPLSLGNDLFENDARIFFLAMYSPQARTVLCKAYQSDRLYPRYTYITYGWYSNQWLTVNDTSCSPNDIASVVQYSLAITQYPETTNGSYITSTGISNDEFQNLYAKQLVKFGYSYLINGEQCFDGMWSFAFALNQTINDLANNDTLNEIARKAEGLNNNTRFRIENFTYRNDAVKQIMFKHLSKTNFQGVTGPVSFTTEGIRTVNRLRVLQYRSQRLQEIASVIETQDGPVFLYYINETDNNVWPLGVPFDGVAENKTVSVALPITIIYSFLAGCGIVFAGVCLVFSFVYRKRKLIRLTSPKLNYLISVGAVVMYISVVIYCFPSYSETASTVICNLRPRFFSLGYCLCFGTILAKMWRVYYIFTNPNLKRKAIKDWHLSLFVFVIMIIDVILIGVLTAYDGARTQATLIRRKERPSSEGIGYRIDYYTYICDSQGRDIWLGILYGYKGIIQVAALFLAFGTRKVNIKGLNDSKYIAAVIYITSVILSIKIIASITLNEHTNIFAALFASCILITATVTLGLIFIPQMIWLYRDPTGKNVFNESSPPVQRNNLYNTNVSTIAVAENQFGNDPFDNKLEIALSSKKTKEVEKGSNEDSKETAEPETAALQSQ